MAAHIGFVHFDNTIKFRLILGCFGHGLSYPGGHEGDVIDIVTFANEPQYPMSE
jgi:hypothetical protein